MMVGRREKNTSIPLILLCAAIIISTTLAIVYILKTIEGQKSDSNPSEPIIEGNKVKLDQDKETPKTLGLMIGSTLTQNFEGDKSDNLCLNCNVIIILVDALRADHMGICGYERNTTPYIDSFARKSIIFDNAISQAPWTTPSVASLFTSTYPHQHNKLRPYTNLSNSLTTLAEVYGYNDYNTFGVVANLLVFPQFNFNQGFDEYNAEESYHADNITEILIEWLDKNKDEQFFVYLHYNDVHSPYMPPTKYLELYKDPAYETNMTYIIWPQSGVHDQGERILEVQDNLSLEDRKFFVDAYDGEIKFVDDNIKKLLDRLEELDLMDKTIIVFTADHGEEFWDHRGWGHGHTLYNEVIRVPLIIWNPRSRERRIECNVGLIDVAPTLIGLTLNLSEEQFQGENLDNLINGGECNEKIIYSEAIRGLYENETKSAIDGKWKLISILNESKDELYNIALDPHERNNLSYSEKEIGDRLLNELNKWLDTTTDYDINETETGLDLEEQRSLAERLQSMGYL